MFSQIPQAETAHSASYTSLTAPHSNSTGHVSRYPLHRHTIASQRAKNKYRQSQAAATSEPEENRNSLDTAIATAGGEQVELIYSDKLFPELREYMVGSSFFALLAFKFLKASCKMILVNLLICSELQSRYGATVNNSSEFRRLMNTLVKATTYADGRKSQETHPIFKGFPRLPNKVQQNIMAFTDPPPPRIVEIRAARQDPNMQNTQNAYAFTSPTPVPVQFHLNRDLRANAERKYKKYFRCVIRGQVCWVWVREGIDLPWLSLVTGIGRNESIGKMISRVFEGLSVTDPDTIRMLTMLAIPAPDPNEKALPHLTKFTAEGITRLTALKQLFLLTESLAKTPDVQEARENRPNGPLILGPPRYNFQSFDTARLEWNMALMASELVDVEAAAGLQRAEPVKIFPHILVAASVAEQ